MQITNNIWIDPKQITSMIIESGADNYTLGMTIMVGSQKYYIRHSPYESVYDIKQKLIEAREKD